MSVSRTNSLDKIVIQYVAAVTTGRFFYECGRTHVLVEPSPLVVSPTVFRGYTCPAGCGACCQRFSLVYLPGEDHPYPLQPFACRINGRSVMFFHDPQTTGGRFCGNLDRESGLCNIHGKHPFSCDFELMRTFISKDHPNRLGLQLYPRKWNMTQINGTKGTECGIIEQRDDVFRDDTARKLRRLKEWCEHLGVPTWLDRIIEWVESGPHTAALRLS